MEFRGKAKKILTIYLFEKQQENFDISGRLAFLTGRRHIAQRESDGRGTRQPGQILTEAAVTISLWVIRLLFLQISLFATFDRQQGN